MLVKDNPSGATEVLGSETGKTQAAHTILSGPINGSASIPTFRPLTAVDVPLGGANSNSSVNGAFVPLPWMSVCVSSSSVTNYGMPAPNISSSVTTAVVADATKPHAVNYKTSVTANNGVAIVGGNFIHSLGNIASIKFTLRLAQTTNMAIWIGLGQTATTASAVNAITAFKNTKTPAVNFVGFRYSTLGGADPTFMCITQTDNTHQTVNAANPSATVDTSMHTFELQYDGSNVYFFIDDVLVGTQSGNVPTGVQQWMIEVDNVNTGNTQSFDFMSVRGITID